MGTKVPRPSIGRVVHFVYGDAHAPAFITNAAFERDGMPTEQELTVFPAGAAPFTTVAHEDSSQTPESATWHWPEYVPES